MSAYYNELDSAAAAMLRNLIAAGHIAPGIVDERSIEDVRPDELVGYTQCHFFAGIGIWSLALRQAGVPDDYPVWSMSCPCQPFSAAGKGAGFADERHLWPAAYHLISQCRPERVVGEQVASKDTNPWIDLVQVDLEALGYAFGVCPFPASGVGAPHIRDRAYWVGNASSMGLERFGIGHSAPRGWQGAVRPIATAGEPGGLADPWCNDHRGEINAANHGQPQADRPANQPCGCGGASCQLADTEKLRWEGEHLRAGRGLPSLGASHHNRSCGMDDPKSQRRGFCDTENIGQTNASVNTPDDASSGAIDGCRPDDGIARPGPVNGHWAAADWLFCRDGKWRPVEPGTFPLAHGMPRSMGAMPPELRGLAELAGLSGASLKRAKQYRVQQLKGYGNAINAQAATVFIEAVVGNQGTGVKA